MRYLPLHFAVIRLIVFLLLAVPLLHFSFVKDSILSSNEIGLYIVCIICSILILPLIGNTINISLLEVVIFLLLVGVPIIQYCFISNTSYLSLLKSISYYTIFLTISIYAKNYRNYLTKTFLQSYFFVINLMIIATLLHLAGFTPFLYIGNKSTLFFNNAGSYGAFLALSLITCYYFIKNQNPIKNIYVILLVIIICLLLIQSQSRSSWIAVFACTMTLMPLKKFSANTLTSKVVIILCLVLAIYFLYIFKFHSANGRILIWITSIEMFRDNWLKGVGIEQFSVNFLKYQASILQNDFFKNYLLNYADESQTAFNDILHFVCERGIMGLFSLFIIVIHILFPKYNLHFTGNEKEVEILRCLLLVILICGISSYPLQTIPLAIIFWVILGIYTSFLNNRRYCFVMNSKIRIGFICVFFLAMSYFTYEKYQSYKNWFQIEQRMSYRQEKAMLSLYPFLNNRPSFLISMSKIYKFKGDLEKSTQFAQQAIRISSKKEHYYYLAELYKNAGRIKDAENIYIFIERSIPHLITPKYLRSILYYEYDCSRFYPMASETLLFQPKIKNESTDKMKQDLLKRTQTF